MRSKEDSLAVILLMTTATIAENHDGLSLRKALSYTGCSRNAYYYNKKKKEDKKKLKDTKLLLQQHRQSEEETLLEKKIEEIVLQRPSYGTRRMAALLTRIIGKPINRKRVQRLY